MGVDQASAGRGFLSGGGRLGESIAAFDWSQTSMGPRDRWSPTITSAVGLALHSPVPIVMLFGEDGVMIYNDAYAVFAGGRHPKLLGSKVREGWPEVAEFNDNVMKVGLAGGTLAYRDQELTLFRNGAPERVWMNLDYSPIPDETGVPVGVIAIVVETSEKVRAERWLAAESDRMRQMFEQAPGFMAVLSGPDHVFDLTNAAYMQLIGHRDVIGKPIREALPEVIEQGFVDLLDGVFATGEPFVGRAVKVSLQREIGAPLEERSLDFIYQPVRDPTGKRIGIFVEGVDVTERVQAEQVIRESEELFRTFAEAMPNHVWASPPDGQLDWFNTRVYEYSGAAVGELDGNRWTNIVHEDDLPHAAAKWQQSLASGQPYEVEFRLRRADGSYRWHLARAVALRDANGAITRWVGTNTDIDDQKRTAEELAQSERRFRLSQSAAGIASLELDIPTGTVIGSDGFWELWGLSKRDSVHISVLESIVLPEHAAVRSTEETRQQGSAAPSVEYRIKRPDTGEFRWLSRHIEFIHDEAGRPLKMFGVMQDITEAKEAQAHQQLLTHELEHRIKNILAMVSAIASQTLRNTDLATANASFNERLRALANAHDILTQTRWTAASLDAVAKSTLTPFATERVLIAGPAVLLAPKMALSLALAINELATNALKYGALSNEAGRVEMRWSVAADGDGNSSLTWSWQEIDGPPVTPPSRRGFGRFLIERVLASDFGGTVALDYLADGLNCTLVAPIGGTRATNHIAEDAAL